MSLKIKIYYPFHPLCGQELNLARPTRKKDGLVTIFDPLGFRLKVPLWMTNPSAANFQLSDLAVSSDKGLVKLCDIMSEFYNKKQKKKKEKTEI